MFSIYMKIIMYTVIVMSSIIYIWHKLLDKKFNFKDYRLYVSFIGMISAAIVNYLTISKFIKILIITIILILFFKYLFKETFKKSIVAPIFTQIIFMFSDCLYAIIIILLQFDVRETISSLTFNAISNVIISIISIIIINLKFVNKIYKKILRATEYINSIILYTFCMIAVLIANVLTLSVYYKMQFQFLLVFNVAMTLFLSSILIYSLKTQNNYNKVSDKYNIAINSLKDYEDMMSKYRINNHENKNLLLAIRAMILNSEKDIPKYIDSIIKDKYNDSEKLLLKVNVIPSGGLRATIYSEILKIKDRNIKYNLEIDKALKTADIIELDTNTIIDVCKIVGVFIDNAIDEVSNIKDGYISINLYTYESYLNIDVANNFRNKIDIDRIFEKGYTTKGTNHGYGLTLVKNIIEKNLNLENLVNINKDIIKQTLKIKIKIKKSRHK